MMSNSKINITILSNMIIQPFVKNQMYSNRDNVNLSFINFSEYNVNSNIQLLQNSDYIIVWINLDLFLENVEFSKNNLSEIKEIVSDTLKSSTEFLLKNSYAKIIFVSVEDYNTYFSILFGSVISEFGFSDVLNYEIYNDFKDEITVLDLKKIIASVGIKQAYCYKTKTRWNMPYSESLIKELIKEIEKQILIFEKISPKCLILDCDNTIWGGIISEDGADAIKLSNISEGRIYKRFQNFIKLLSSYGIILCIASKNDIDDVFYVFDNNREMILNKNDISCFKVNWENKVKNIIEISKEMNISFDSMVFVDDSPYEIENIKNNLPKVTTILFSKDEELYNKFRCFNLEIKSDEEQIKTRMESYKHNQIRKQLYNGNNDIDEFNQKLNTSIQIKISDKSEYKRIAELSQRVNRCTNGTRYSLGQLKRLYCNDYYRLYSVYLSDTLGDLGLISSFGVYNNHLDFICISCRALGRNVDKEIITFLKKNFTIKTFDFISTGKNESFYMILKNNFN